MSERDELEKATADSKAKQTVNAVNDYLDLLVKRLDAELKLSHRADVGFFLTVLVTIGMEMLMLLIGTPQTYVDMALTILQVIQLLMLARSWIVSREWSNTHSEFVGALYTLRLLGMIPPRDAERRSQKRPAWEKGIELVKGWSAKKKAQQGAYQPA